MVGPITQAPTKSTCRHVLTRSQLDKLVGIAMLVAATVVFLYYTFWTLFMVNISNCASPNKDSLGLGVVSLSRAASSSRVANTATQPFVDSDHPLQNFFPPRVWAVRIPVILILLASAVVGSFLGVVMIRSNKKKAAKAKAAAAKKKS